MSAIKKKIIVTMLATIAIVASFIFGTVAYFTETVSSDHNIIIMTGDAKAEVSDVVLEHGTNIPLPSDRELDVIPGYKYAKNVTVENTGKLSFAYMNKILESKANEKKGVQSMTASLKNPLGAKKSRYNYDEIERRTFLNVTKKGGEQNGI